VILKNLELKKVCEVCSLEFVGKADKRACSKKCYNKLWNSENVEHVKNYKKEYYHNGNPEYKAYADKKTSLWMYLMSVEQFDKLLNEQNGHCALCDNKNDLNGYRLHVDHDHSCCDTRGRQRTCGKCNRGLLCGICNRKLGFLEKFLLEFKIAEAKENTWLYRALAYIEKYKVKI
jgi:Recombination endonuclease VII